MPRVRRPAPSLPAAALLRLVRLASPALPVGGFSYSEGLEAAVDHGRVHDEASAAEWIGQQLWLTQARSELPLAAAAFHAWRRGDAARVVELNAWALATRETEELRQQTVQMGRSLADWLRQRAQAAADGTPPAASAPEHQLAALAPAPAWPVGLGLALVRSGAPLRDGLLALGFGWCENMVQAALKAVPLGQNAGQRVLDALADELPAVVDAVLAQPDSARQSFAPMLAVLSARHETQYSRLFRS